MNGDLSFLAGPAEFHERSSHCETVCVASEDR